jgi:hypothetical protein
MMARANGATAPVNHSGERMSLKERLGDRRADLRFEIIGQLWGSVEAVQHLPLRNLGRGGALVEAESALRAEAVHTVRLTFIDQANDMQVRVRHVTPVQRDGAERFLIGLEFIEPGAAALDQIDRIVAAGFGDAATMTEA